MNLNVGELSDLIEALTAFDHFDPTTKTELLSKLESERQKAITEGRGVGLDLTAQDVLQIVRENAHIGTERIGTVNGGYRYESAIIIDGQDFELVKQLTEAPCGSCHETGCGGECLG